MLYRLHTQDKNRRFIIEVISDNFKSFTIIPQIGYWQSKKEKSLCIEIDNARPADVYKITRICKAICGYNKQDCVMVQKIECNTEFIEV